LTPLVQELRDIRGLDAAPWWPIAPGWWLVLLALLLAGAVTYLVARWWRNRVPGSWQGDARRQFRVLEERLRWADARTVAAELSELLRRVAMARHGRRACAGLVGESWLEWLERHDPEGFAWREEGRVLIELPYAPPGRRAAGAELEPLLRAARNWVVADRPEAGGAWRLLRLAREAVRG
jgi:hypothetical protein